MPQPPLDSGPDLFPLPTRPLQMTVAQTSAGDDQAGNLDQLEALLAPVPPGDLLALPEIFAWRGKDDEYRARAEAIPGNVVRRLAALAAQRGEWILAGSVLEKSGTALFNTSVLLNRTGAIAATYRKMHLFEASLDDGTLVRESAIYEAGTSPTLAVIEGWRCGLAICYDLRFPELFRHYAAQGAHLFLIPSNFTQQTGQAHWETLLRARAIENQAFVAAPNQCGQNPGSGLASYGHSLIIGPWGEVLAGAAEQTAVLSAQLDPQALASIRRRIPVLRQRRLP